MRLVRLQNGGSTTTSSDNTSNFTTYFNPPMEIPKDSEIALQSMSLKLRPNVVTISAQTANVAFSTLDVTEANYDAYVADHTATLSLGEVTTTELGNNFTTGLNKTLFFSSDGDHVKEQGAEIFMQVEPLSNVTSVTFAARLENEYCAPPTDQVTVNTGGAVYDYTVAAGPPTSATLARTAATVDEVDSWLSTDAVFCRGSGAIQWTDGYNYELPGAWTGNNTFTSTADFDIANLGFGAGATFRSITNLLKVAVTVAQGGGGGGKAVITIAGGAVNGADTVILQAGPGWVLGLIASQYLADPATILDNIEYGVALPNSAMVTADPGIWLEPSSFHTKRSKDASWNQGGAPGVVVAKTFGGDQNVIQMILGRRDGAGGEPPAGYDVHVEKYQTDGTTFVEKIGSDLPYVYGNYHLVMGVCTTGTSLSDIRWTASKINNATTGYYERASPDLALRDDGLVLPTTNGVTFFPAGAGKFTLDLLNQTTATLYGYSAIRTPSNRINSSSVKTVTVRAQSAVNFTYSFSENLTMLLNLPLDSYDRGIQRNVLSSIPFGVQTLTDDTVVHQPPFPNFIRIKNAQPLYIDALTVRLENDQQVLIDEQNSVSVSLLLRPTMH